MEYSIEQINKLPKVEVSFQDDFSGSEREYTITPSYILREMSKNGASPMIGDKILLWEKDLSENKEYFLCNIGEIIEANTEHENLEENKAEIEGKKILIKISKYFDLPINNLEVGL